jgi:hypothetical protein
MTSLLIEGGVEMFEMTGYNFFNLIKVEYICQYEEIG